MKEMNGFDYYLEVFRRFSDFSGRSRRKEYWYFSLVNILILAVAFGIDWQIGEPVLTLLYFVVAIIPGGAVTVRRLHDSGKSGWLFLVNFIPYVGWLISIFLMLLPSDVGPNIYGPSPTDKPEGSTNDDFNQSDFEAWSATENAENPTFKYLSRSQQISSYMNRADRQKGKSNQTNPTRDESTPDNPNNLKQISFTEYCTMRKAESKVFKYLHEKQMREAYENYILELVNAEKPPAIIVSKHAADGAEEPEQNNQTDNPKQEEEPAEPNSKESIDASANEFKPYEQAFLELETDTKDVGVWAAAYSSTETEEEARKEYIKLRVAMLRAADRLNSG